MSETQRVEHRSDHEPGGSNAALFHRGEELFRLLVESVEDYAIYMLDPQGHVASWNPGAERIKGYQAAEILGQHFSRFYTSEDVQRGKPEQELRIALAEGRVEDEGWRVRKDGSRFWANAIITAVYDEEGNLRGFAKVTRDLTARMEAEERMKEYSTRLERSNRELQDFAMVASHDLQEPLRKIQAFGDLLKEECETALTADGREYVGHMQDAARRMQDLIQALLSLSRVSTRGQPFIPVDLSDVVREVMADLEMSLQRSGGRVEVNGLPTIEADRMQMRQLFQNLIGNALKLHRPQDPPVIRLSGQLVSGDDFTVDEASSPPLCQINVEDNGIGFDEKYLDRIFSPFQRLHDRTEYEGTGMGLAICRRIIERHEGRITARSAPGRGATFTLLLPVQQRSDKR